MEIRKYENFHLEEIINLYSSVGWTNYLERTGILEEAYANSLCVIGAYDNEKLVGTIRAVGDGRTIVFVQDRKTKAFYRSVGFTASDDIGCVAFIRM